MPGSEPGPGRPGDLDQEPEEREPRGPSGDEGEGPEQEAGATADDADAVLEADPDDSEDGSGPDRAGRVQQVLAVAALVLSGVSILGSMVVVTVLRRGLGGDQPDHGALLGQVNPWYAAAIGAFLAAFVLLAGWGILNLRRAPVGQRGPGVVPAGIGLAFAALAWAFSFYRRLD